MADRSRSRSPQRDDDVNNNAPPTDDNSGVPHDNVGAGGADGGGDGGEEVKLYVGNLDYSE